MSRMRTIGTIAAFLTAAVGAGALSASIWTKSVLLSPEHAQQVLTRNQAYTETRDAVLRAQFDTRMAELGLRPEERTLLRSWVLGVATPDEVEARLDHALGQALPYLAGRRDTFTIRPNLEPLVLALPEQSSETELARFGIESVIIPRLLEALRQLEQAPLGLQIGETAVASAVRTVVDEEWLEGEILGATTQLAYYLVGRTSQFEVHVDYRTRLDAATNAVKAILSHIDLRSLFAQLVVPLALDGLAQNPELGTTVSPEVLRQTIVASFPEEEADRLANAALDCLAEYLSARRQSLSMEANVGPLREQAATMGAALLAPDGGEQEGVVRSLILAGFPEQMVFDESQLRGALGEEAFLRIQEARGTITHGFRYTEAELSRDARSSWGLSEEQLTSLRFVLSLDYVYTEQDLAAGTFGIDAHPIEQTRFVFSLEWVVILVTLVGFHSLLVIAPFHISRRPAVGLFAIGAGILSAAVVVGPIARWVLMDWANSVGLTAPFDGFLVEVIHSAELKGQMWLGGAGLGLVVIAFAVWLGAARRAKGDGPRSVG